MSTSNVAKAVKPSGARASKHSEAYELLARGMKRVNVAALVEAGEEYGDDHDRELADLESGRHPLQRRKPAR